MVVFYVARTYERSLQCQKVFNYGKLFRRDFFCCCWVFFFKLIFCLILSYLKRKGGSGWKNCLYMLEAYRNFLFVCPITLNATING